MMPPQANRSVMLILLFASTLFTSASLMFILQPLFGKLLLPLLGGSPSVWNACMVFYQSILFFGYWYAHGLSTYLSTRRQIWVHASLIAISFIMLPVALPEPINPPTDGNPVFWLLWTLLLAIGLPFFVVSTTSPLMQKWFAQVGHDTSSDPYYLYAASNIGSLAALLSYPFLLEPVMGLNDQRAYWSFGYGLLIALIVMCAGMLAKNAPENGELATQAEDSSQLDWFVQLRWLLLAFVPSSLLLGLTNFISTDIASVPLLWIIPLAVFLLSFVIVFSRWNDKVHPVMRWLQPVFLIPFLIYAFVNPADMPYWAYLVLHVIAFFFSVMVCHGELARLRPATQHLTRFYLIMSFAGMLGGLFNTFAAPLIFNGVYEYPVMIVAALLLRPGKSATTPTQWALQLGLPGLLIAAGLLFYRHIGNRLDYFDVIALSLIGLSFVTFVLRNRPTALGGLTGAVIVLALGLHNLSSNTLYQERTFFGVLAVRDSVLNNEQNQPETYHELFHGTTKHGAQRLAPDLSKIPLTYYSRPGPMGQLFAEFDSNNADWTIGVVGLGAGALACYAKPQQHWSLYEIDPLVVDIAKDTRYFSYLNQCAPNAAIVVGDARLSLTKAPDHSFDLLVMDAFSSDSVPTHLLTEQALQLYFTKLKPGGILAFHITNRHLALKKVLSIHAEHLHLAALLQEYQPQRDMPLVIATDWVVMTQQPEVLEPLRLSQLGAWQKMPLYFDMKPWTDDFTNIVRIWK